MGVALKADNKIDEAIDCYLKAIKINPNQEIAYNNLGTAFSESKRTKEALDFYEKVFKVNPKNLEGYLDKIF